MASYTLTASDLNFVKVLESKINIEITKKWEAERQKFITLLTTLKNNPNAPEKPKAIITELLNRLLVSSYGYGSTTLEVTDSTELNNIRQEILKLVNQKRLSLWLNALTMNDKLLKSAQIHAEDMAIHNYLSHTNLDGKNVDYRVKAQGYNYSFVGENIAWNQRTPQQVMDSWMNSPGHKANILSKDFKEIWIWLQNRYRVQVFWTSQ